MPQLMSCGGVGTHRTRHRACLWGGALPGEPERLASPSPVQDAGFLLLELGLGQHARRQQLAELLQQGEPVTHVGWLGRGGRCLRRRDGLGVGLLRLCRGRVLRGVAGQARPPGPGLGPAQPTGFAAVVESGRARSWRPRR